MPRAPLRPTDPSLQHLAALDEVYRDAAELFAGWTCPSSTECCRFGITGREPYVTSIELAAVRKAIAARGGSRTWKKAPSASQDPVGAKASKITLPMVRDERPCPMLTDAGRCAIYQARPLGCRTFYCDRATEGGRVRLRDVNPLVRRIQEIAARHQPGGDQGRPLTHVL
jgi:Fe-S-cluster containining protein